MRSVGVIGVVMAAAAFVLGLVVGGLGPRQEVRELRRELFELEKSGGGLGGSALARMMTERLTRPEAQRDGPVSGDDRDLAEVLAEAQDAEPTAGEPAVVTDPPPAKAFDPTELEAVREGMLLRASQARTALDQELDPTEEQTAAVDAAIDTMNDRLVDLSYALQEQLRAGGEPERPAVTRLVADVLTTMADAEDALRATMSPDQQAAVGSEMTDPLNFIDPAVLDVLAEIDPAALRDGAP
jgi:hypothetical protein